MKEIKKEGRKEGEKERKERKEILQRKATERYRTELNWKTEIRREHRARVEDIIDGAGKVRKKA